MAYAAVQGGGSVIVDSLFIIAPIKCWDLCFVFVLLCCT